MAVTKWISSWLFWTGATGVLLTIAGFLWFYEDYRAVHERLDTIIQSGGISVDPRLPFLPRVLGLTGLMLIVVTIGGILAKLLQRRGRARQ